MSDHTAPEAPDELPSAHEVKRIMRGQNIKLAIGGLVIAAGLVVVASLTASSRAESAASRAASEDSNNATKVQLAAQGRNACITERRNAQADAAGRISIAANEAEVAGLVNDDEAEALRQLGLFQQAVDDWQRATDSLAPETLNLPVSKGGCGPPILTLEDLEKAEK